MATLMKRRHALVALVGLAQCCVSLPGEAENSVKVRRIGFLNPRTAENELDAAFKAELRRLGHHEGRTIEIEYRWGANTDARAEALARELLARNVELIVTATTVAVRAATRTTRSVPIVMAASADPVGAGLIESLARPGGNVTGLALESTDTAAKRLQLLRELLPSASRVAVLIERASTQEGDQVNALLVGELQRAAERMAITLIVKGARIPDDLEIAFESFHSERADALLVQVSRLMIDERKRIAQLAASHRLPTIYETEVFVDAGGLLSFGPALEDMYRRAAGYVDRILKGAKPAELPVALPIRYDLVVNRRTAEAMSLPLPQSLLLRADRVVQ